MLQLSQENVKRIDKMIETALDEKFGESPIDYATKQFHAKGLSEGNPLCDFKYVTNERYLARVNLKNKIYKEVFKKENSNERSD